MALTDEQQRIVAHHANGHTRVSAVAGSGKTTTLIARIRRLLEDGANPRRILVLMFNRSAAQHFRASLERATQSRFARLPEIRTYHAFALKLVTGFVHRGDLPDWPLETRAWRKEQFAREALRRVLDKHPESEQLDEFLLFVDLRKAVIYEDHVSLAPFPAEYRTAYEHFEEVRREACCRFFEDLLLDLALLFQRSPEARRFVSDHVDAILVDEFQDTSEVQLVLLKAVAGSRAKVTIVGDVDQCIYSFRGAEPSIMASRFEEDFKPTERLDLSRTFRFGHRLALAANHVIARNTLRDDQLCVAAEGNPDTLIFRVPEVGSGHPISELLSAWREQGGRLNDCLVLVRLWAQAFPIEIECLIHQIPYQLDSKSGSVFARREVKALLGYLRLADRTLADHPERSQILDAMLSAPTLYANAEIKSELVQRIAGGEPAREVFVSVAQSDSRDWFARRLRERADAFRFAERFSADSAAAQVLEDIAAYLNLPAEILASNEREQTKSEQLLTVDGLIEFAKREGRSTRDFLTLCDQLAAKRPDDDLAPADRLRIMTIHRAKGLEADWVYIPDIREARFPYYLTHIADRDLEAERRLFYVAITRARRFLHLGHPRSAPVLDRLLSAPQPRWSKDMPSRFLWESRLALSCELGGLIHEGRAEAAGRRPEPVDIANRYLGKLGLSLLPCSRKQAKPPSASKTRRSSGPSPGDKVFGPGFFGSIRKGQTVRFFRQSRPLYRVVRIWRSAVSGSETVLLQRVGEPGHLELENTGSKVLVLADHAEGP